MKVYVDVFGIKRLIGYADIPPDAEVLFEVPLFSANATMIEQFTLGTVTHIPVDGSTPTVERAVLLSSYQVPELLPGWTPLSDFR